uniref:Uncharacterized protein n=1 Tax=Musa acuminata subsp. malaccensis TaxID=214687 RepID=A0A804LAS8_MUSAM
MLWPGIGTVWSNLESARSSMWLLRGKKDGGARSGRGARLGGYDRIFDGVLRWRSVALNLARILHNRSISGGGSRPDPSDG